MLLFVKYKIVTVTGCPSSLLQPVPLPPFQLCVKLELLVGLCCEEGDSHCFTAIGYGLRTDPLRSPCAPIIPFGLPSLTKVLITPYLHFVSKGL